MTREVFERGIVRLGNNYRLKRVVERAERGEKIVLGFLGGSITQGSLADPWDMKYADRVHRWWQERFPKAEIVCVNAGVGGTTSQFGVSRIDKDLLAYQPDVCFLEFSVNDTDNDFFMETYEGTVRKMLLSEKKPPVLVLHNVQYNDGVSAQRVHAVIGEHYSLPACSIRDGVYQEILAGNLKREDVTPDMLHPNTYGHELLAKQLIHLIERTLEDGCSEEYTVPETTVTANRFHSAKRLQNTDACRLEGFQKDEEKQQYFTDFFKNGWTATEKGASVFFDLSCSCLAVQYRKTIQKPASAAIAVIDNDEENAVLLDGDFKETWGDCLYCETLINDDSVKKHTLEIRLVDTHPQDALPFYLISVLYA